MCCECLLKKFGNNFSKCFTDSTVAVEKGKKFTINRSNKAEKFCKIKVDNCLIVGNIPKCDYAFVRCLNQDYYFVELKGTDVEAACNQLTATISHFKKLIAINKEQIFGFIVSSSIPREADQKYRKYKENFLKQLGKDLNRGTNHYIHYV